MSELPDRPDLDQLRRQARELLRAAADGEPRAITRLRAVSGRVTLSAAQLAIAREHGCPSWPALGAEVRRRRRMLESAGRQVQGGDVRDRLDARADRWSFGGGTAIGTSAGLLFPEVLVVGAGHAVLDASLMSSGTGEPAAARARRLLVSGMPLARLVPGRARASRRAAVAALGSLARPGDLTVIDDRGARYALHPGGMWGKFGPSGGPAGPLSVGLGLDPVPGREVRWLRAAQSERGSDPPGTVGPPSRADQPAHCGSGEPGRARAVGPSLRVDGASPHQHRGRRGLPQAALLGCSGQDRRD